MIFEQSKSVERFGQRAGYLFSYLLFTTILYFALNISDRLPGSWSYIHIMIVTFCIVLVGMITKRFLK